MLTKVLFAALLALSTVATVSSQAGVPPPECNPCPFVNYARRNDHDQKTLICCPFSSVDRCYGQFPGWRATAGVQPLPVRELSPEKRP